MCGRIVITLPNDAMAQLFGAVPANTLPPVPNYNVCPTAQVHVVATDGDIRRLGAMRWGFVPTWYKSLADGPLLINARAETIAAKPAFREACRQRRCLLPASGFYEWTKDADGNRLPWYISRSDGAPLAMAGVWQTWGDERIAACAVVTVQANAEIGHIDHRMPVILEQQDWAKWLGEEGHGAAPLMKPADAGILNAHRVNSEVNSNRASGPTLIEPIAP
ncbi:SOS response-associated peptidase [Thalassovita sp.]|uniref:SOS response-associated peptidase n=1 Tax=Thalassovita sp. TaxID=1979401 RepID=UPI0029DE66F3|nr:SOS response-associated peptidase [Thalassovita sp.]